MRSRAYRKRSSDYLLPFLILVGVGVIAVLSWQLWSQLQGKKGDVYFYVVSGHAKVLPYGTAEWENAFSGTKLLVGDAVKTLDNSRMVLQFYNGTMVRLDADTQVTLTDLNRQGEQEKIALALDYGKLWTNHLTTEDIKSSRFEARMAHMLAKDTGTVFELEKADTEIARVINGSLKVDVMPNDDNRDQVADTVAVGVGQEIDLDEATLKAFRNHENPSVLLALRDDFKSSEWYSWNSLEDQHPTDFVHQKTSDAAPGTGSATPADLQGSQDVQSLPPTAPGATPASPGTAPTLPGTTSPLSGVTPPTSDSASLPSSALTAPVIVKPVPADRTITSGKVTVQGTVSAVTAKVKVRQTINGATDEYVLSKYKAGDTSFVYNLAESYNNLKSGTNTYVFYALDNKGKASNPTEIKIQYNKPGAAVTPDSAVASGTAVNAVSAATGTETLAAPTVLTFNGAKSSTVTVGVVKIEGEVHGAAKVVVNGYTLSKFQPGSTIWQYWANEKGNLSPGVNNFDVYAISATGQESTHLKFTLTYNKPS